MMAMKSNTSNTHVHYHIMFKKICEKNLLFREKVEKNGREKYFGWIQYKQIPIDSAIAPSGKLASQPLQWCFENVSHVFKC